MLRGLSRYRGHLGWEEPVVQPATAQKRWPVFCFGERGRKGAHAMTNRRMGRRQFLLRGAVGAGMLAFPSAAVLGEAPAVAAPSFARVPRFTVALPIPVKARPVGANTYHITQRQTQQTLHPRLGKTAVWGYDDGRHGPLYPGPTIEVWRGIPTRSTTKTGSRGTTYWRSIRA